MKVIALALALSACGGGGYLRGDKGPQGVQGEVGPGCIIETDDTETPWLVCDETRVQMGDGEAPVPDHPSMTSICLWDGDKWITVWGKSRITLLEMYFDHHAMMGTCEDHPGVTDIN